MLWLLLGQHVHAFINESLHLTHLLVLIIPVIFKTEDNKNLAI